MTRDGPTQGDPRVRRTRSLIVEALVHLTVQKGFAAVTVQDIVREAGINRATFYRHYQDKFDLVEQYAKAVYHLADETPDHGFSTGEDAIQALIPGIVKVLEHVRQNAAFFRVMLGKNGDPAFATRIRMYIQERIRRSLPEEMPSANRSAEVGMAYISSGAVGVILWWLENETSYSAAEMAGILSRLVAADLAKLSSGGR